LLDWGTGEEDIAMELWNINNNKKCISEVLKKSIYGFLMGNFSI